MCSSLERHMECGIGLCGHCQLGPTYDDAIIDI
ncbi:MAG: hypothetical protein H0X47_21635 [Nitrospirales bacterium]|nr:hypothetical protein [Nitrospirales bacterium]